MRAMKIRSFRYDLLPLKDKLFRLALRITLNRPEAEDIVQDTMLKVWEKREQTGDIDSIEAYCMTTCRNLALDLTRRRERANLPLDEASADVEDSSLGVEEKMEQEERLKKVHDIFNRLPEKQRTIMQLRDIEGKSVRETAEIAGMTEENVKVTLFRARKAIREEFGKTATEQ